MKTKCLPLVLSLSLLGGMWWLAAAPTMIGLQRPGNGEVVLSSSAAAGEWYRVERASGLTDWQAMATVQSAGADELVDSGAPYATERYYRAVPATGAGLLTGDHLPTANGDAILHPVHHASVVVSWNGKTLYSDPSGGGTLFAGLARADVIVVTHAHSDHFSPSTLAAVLGTNGVIFAPQSVYGDPTMTAALKAKTTVMANGATASAHGMEIQAVAMYNISNSPHPKGVGNGYVITLGGKRIYFSGDTEATPEMRALTNIDAAFVCMSLPSNMTVDAAADGVRAFKPKIVTPYHYQQSTGGTVYDIARFKQLVGTDLGIEVRLRKLLLNGRTA